MMDVPEKHMLLCQLPAKLQYDDFRLAWINVFDLQESQCIHNAVKKTIKLILHRQLRSLLNVLCSEKQRFM